MPEDVSYSVESVTHEIIHYLQDENGMLNIDSCGSDNEYQAYVLNFIYNKACKEQVVKPRSNCIVSDWDDLEDMIEREVKRKGKGFTYTTNFINWLNKMNHADLSESFRDYYREVDSQNSTTERQVYYLHHDSKYDWQWEVMLNKLGFKKK